MTERRDLPRRAFATILGAVVLACLWHRNYNLLGDTYDYSIVTSVTGYLHAGLLPYRDFTTPLQSLTIYLCCAAESIFGPHYLSLAYMNLVIGLIFYLVLVRLLRTCVSPWLGVLAAIALCAATYFQHGVILYNSLAITFLIVLVLHAAIIYRRQQIDRGTFLILCLLLYFSSMCKLNYHLIAIALCGGILMLHFLLRGAERKKALWVLPGMLFFGLILGPCTEVLVNRTSFGNFVYCVITTPKQRVKYLVNILDPNTLLGRVSDYYPDNWCGGVYLFAFLIFAGCVYYAVRAPSETSGANPSATPSRALRYFGPFVLMAFYFAAMVISVTNRDVEWLTASPLVAGLLVTFIMFAPGMSHEQAGVFKLAIFLLAGFFFVGAGASAFMHSRVRFGEPSWSKAMVGALGKEKKLSALNTAVPFYSAEQISPDFVPYLGGVRFTEETYLRLVKIAACIKKYDLKAQPKKVYWGSGVQILDRVYGNVPAGRLPLWYHLNVSVRNQDASAIIAAFKQNDFDWIISSHWFGEMPDEVRNYLYDHFENMGDEDVIILRKKDTPLRP